MPEATHSHEKMHVVWSFLLGVAVLTSCALVFSYVAELLPRTSPPARDRASAAVILVGAACTWMCWNGLQGDGSQFGTALIVVMYDVQVVARIVGIGFVVPVRPRTLHEYAERHQLEEVPLTEET